LMRWCSIKEQTWFASSALRCSALRPSLIVFFWCLITRRTRF